MTVCYPSVGFDPAHHPMTLLWTRCIDDLLRQGGVQGSCWWSCWGQAVALVEFTTGHFFPSLTLKPAHSKLLGNIIKVSLRLQLLKPETLDFSAHQGVSLKKSVR